MPGKQTCRPPPGLRRSSSSPPTRVPAASFSPTGAAHWLMNNFMPTPWGVDTHSLQQPGWNWNRSIHQSIWLTHASAARRRNVANQGWLTTANGGAGRWNRNLMVRQSSHRQRSSFRGRVQTRGSRRPRSLSLAWVAMRHGALARKRTSGRQGCSDRSQERSER